MLVLKRREGQWVDIVHKSGDVLRIRAYRIREGSPATVDLAFDDNERNFDIQRPERRLKSPFDTVSVTTVDHFSSLSVLPDVHAPGQQVSVEELFPDGSPF